MRSKAIDIAKTKGYSDADATVQFDKVKADCGAEPTAAMLADYDRDAYLKISVARPLAMAWSEAFGPKSAGDDKTPAEDKKGRKFKAGKTYSPAELAAFYPTEKNNPDYRAACAAITREAWVIAVGGKYNEEKSAYYLTIYRDEEIPPATVMIGNVPIAPVLFGEDATPKEAWISPFAPSRFLDVEMTCPVTGASFKGYVKDQGTAGEDDIPMRA
ncbi:hypothetical protein, partial [Erythrobacter sp.]|uniref:hypothetical protein n=1 Tax=Erythrobacter sp. TaxID=1042 RepID=UPI00311E0CCB